MTKTVQVSGAGYVSGLSLLIQNSIEGMSVWLFVMFWVIIADLATASYKVYKDDTKEFRVSKAIRDTLAKMVVYYAVVVAAVFTAESLKMPEISYWACALIFLAEGLSIVGNLLKAHGYELDTKSVVKLIVSKAKMPEGIIKPCDHADD